MNEVFILYCFSEGCKIRSNLKSNHPVSSTKIGTGAEIVSVTCGRADPLLKIKYSIMSLVWYMFYSSIHATMVNLATCSPPPWNISQPAWHSIVHFVAVAYMIRSETSRQTRHPLYPNWEERKTRYSLQLGGAGEGGAQYYNILFYWVLRSSQ